MSFFNAVYTLGGCRTSQPVQENSKISITLAREGVCVKTGRWLKWLVSFPIQIVHGAYNTACLLLSKDINKVVAHQVFNGNAVHYMPFLKGKSGYIITSPKIIRAITLKFRDDPAGPFERELGDPFISILKALYPAEEVDSNDFLLSCSRQHVKGYRDPLLEYIGPKALPDLKPKLVEVAQEVLESLKDEPVSAKSLAETYTVAIFARLFLNLPGTLQDFQNIGRAFTSVTEYQFLKKWKTPSKAQTQQYAVDLETLRSVIELSSGKFREALSTCGLSPIRIKGELLLAYGAGSETTSAVLQYVLWHIGQDVKLQEAILKEVVDVEQILASCLEKYTPASLISRFARHDLEIVVENPGAKSWRYPIAKGDALIISPLLTPRMTFGGGVHLCPGQWLARAEIVHMVKTLLHKFEMTSYPRKKELSTVPGFGFIKVEPIELSLRQRI